MTNRSPDRTPEPGPAPLDTPLDIYDAVGLAELIRNGDLREKEVLELVADRIATRDPAINALVATRLDEARDEVARGLPDGPLRGVPIGIKDLYCDVAGLPSTHGSRMFEHAVAKRDADLVIRYRAAGLAVLGKTNTAEFGASASTEPALHGPTRNPWNPAYSAGGSSGGAAAAVAAGILPAAHATDAAGSIRIPASACGLFGMKPSRGLVWNGPRASALSVPMAVSHAVTRTVRDSAALLDAAAGAVPGAPFATPAMEEPFSAAVRRPPVRLRIGYTTVAPDGTPVDPEIAAAVEEAAALFERLGHEVRAAGPSFDPDLPGRALDVLFGAGLRGLVDTVVRARGRALGDDELEPMTRRQYEEAAGVTGSAVLHALQETEQLGRTVAGFYADHDIWLSPTLPAPPPRLGVLDTAVPGTADVIARYTVFTRIANLTGQPAASLPFGRDAAGLPIGVQITAPHGHDAVVLRLSAQFEEAAPWDWTAPRPPTA
ncbi:amidase [Spirillospora sp. NPDC049024]